MKRVGEWKGVRRKENRPREPSFRGSAYRKLPGGGIPLSCSPTPGSIFPEGMDQELTGLLPNLESFLPVCPNFSNQNRWPQWRSTGLISHLRQTWSPNRIHLWKFPPEVWDIVHFRTSGKWLYIREKWVDCNHLFRVFFSSPECVHPQSENLWNSEQKKPGVQIQPVSKEITYTLILICEMELEQLYQDVLWLYHEVIYPKCPAQGHHSVGTQWVECPWINHPQPRHWLWRVTES